MRLWVGLLSDAVEKKRTMRKTRAIGVFRLELVKSIVSAPESLVDRNYRMRHHLWDLKMFMKHWNVGGSSGRHHNDASFTERNH